MTQRDSVNGRENTAGMFLFFSSLFFHRLIFSREGNLNGSVRVVEIIVEFTIYVYLQLLSFELFLEFLQFFPSLSMLSKKEESNETVHLYNVPRAFNRASWSKLGYGVQFFPASRSSIRYFNELFKNKASLIIHYSLNRNDPRLYKPTSDQLQWYTGINTTQAFLNKVIARFFN